jgi:hypothetical protein
MGRGKNKRQWALTDAEFEQFRIMFAEAELFELPEGQTLEEYAKGFKLTFVN